MVRRGVVNIVNTKTGKKYTVRSFTNIDKRIEDYEIKLAYGNHSNKRLQHDYNKYGKKNFRIEPVNINCTTKEEVNRIGDQEIRRNKRNRNSYNSRKGNVTFDGGNPEAKLPSGSGVEKDSELVHNYEPPKKVYKKSKRNNNSRVLASSSYRPKFNAIPYYYNSKPKKRKKSTINGPDRKRVKKERQNEDSVKYCVNCKTKVDKDDKFCIKCGHDLSKTVEVLRAKEIEKESVEIKTKENNSRDLKWLYFIILIVFYVIFVRILRIIYF